MHVRHQCTKKVFKHVRFPLLRDCQIPKMPAAVLRSCALRKARREVKSPVTNIFHICFLKRLKKKTRSTPRVKRVMLLTSDQDCVLCSEMQRSYASRRIGRRNALVIKWERGSMKPSRGRLRAHKPRAHGRSVYKEQVHKQAVQETSPCTWYMELGNGTERC